MAELVGVTNSEADVCGPFAKHKIWAQNGAQECSLFGLFCGLVHHFHSLLITALWVISLPFHLITIVPTYSNSFHTIE